MNCLTISDLTKYYGKTAALRDVSFSMTPGIYGLLGPNGAGKSTLMQILTQTLHADRGSITWNGNILGRNAATGVNKSFFGKLSYVPQQQALFPDFTAWEYLDYISILKEVPENRIESEIMRVLKDVELGDHAGERIRTFSGGMRQRLMIAQSLMNDPLVILLDEPTTGLDPRQRMILKDLLKEKSHDTIILLSTHIVSDIEALADQVILINHGRIVTMKPPADLIREADISSINHGHDKDREVLSELEKAYLYYCREDMQV